MKKLLMALALALSLAVVGCGDSDGDEAPADDTAAATTGATETEATVAQEAPEEVTLRVFTRWSDVSPPSQAFRDRLEEFQTLNPHITIVDESINDEAGFNDKLKAFIATGDMPAIFQNYGGADVFQYIEAGLYLDLDPAFEADAVWKSDFMDFFAQWQYDEVPGTFAVPYEFFGISLFYNSDILAEVGEQVPETIADLERVSDKVLGAGYIPLAFGEKDTFKGDHLFVTLSLLKNGPTIMQDLADGTVRWDSPEVVDVLTIMSDWNDKGYLGENVVGVDYATEDALFFGGEAAMKFDGSWFLGSAEASEIAEMIEAAPFPYFANATGFAATSMGGPGAGLSVSGQLEGAEREAAIELLKFLSSVEHFTYVQDVAQGGVYPVIMEPSEQAGPVTASYITVVNDIDLVPVGVLLPELTTQMRDSVQGLFAGLSPEEAAQQIADRHDEVAG